MRRGLAIRSAPALLCAALATAPIAAAAAEYGSVGAPGAILYDAPSTSATMVAVAPPGMPVELLTLLDRWVKVRDLTGDVFWLDAESLTPRRTLVATMIATVRAAAEDTATVLLRVDRGVLFDFIELPRESPGWVRVRHQDGVEGYVRAAEVWGS